MLLTVPHASRTLHAFEWLMSCVIVEYVTWWICALVKFVECCDYVDWCICTLVDFVDGCEWLNYALLHVLLACAYTLGEIYLMIITWIIWSWIIHYVIDWNAYLFIIVYVDYDWCEANLLVVLTAYLFVRMGRRSAGVVLLDWWVAWGKRELPLFICFDVLD